MRHVASPGIYNVYKRLGAEKYVPFACLMDFSEAKLTINSIFFYFIYVFGYLKQNFSLNYRKRYTYL